MATVGLSISMSSKALARELKNSAIGSGSSRHVFPERFAPIAHLKPVRQQQMRSGDSDYRTYIAFLRDSEKKEVLVSSFSSYLAFSR